MSNLEGTTMRSGCSEHQKKVAAFFLGDLTEGEKQELETHFAICSNCRSERDSYARAIQQLTSAGEEDIPHHFFGYPDEAVFIHGSSSAGCGRGGRPRPQAPQR